MASLTEYATYTLKHTAIVPALLAYTIGSRHSLRVSLHGPSFPGATTRNRPNLVTRKSRFAKRLTHPVCARQAYLAAQQLGPAPELSEELKKKLSWRRNLLGLILVFGIFGSEIYLISTQNEKVLAVCCRYLFAAAFQRSIYLVRDRPSTTFTPLRRTDGFSGNNRASPI